MAKTPLEVSPTTIGALDAAHNVAQTPLPGGAGSRRQQVGDDLGVAGGCEGIALLLQVVPQYLGVHQIAVVPQGQWPAGALQVEGLGVLKPARAFGGIAGVAYGDLAGQIGEVGLIEHLRDKAHAGAEMDFPTVGSGYARAFLPSMLEGIQAVESNPGYVFPWRVDAEDSAGLS